MKECRIDKAISLLIKATIFLLPLFFLPWTSEYFEFNKQLLLRLTMPTALFLWLIKSAVLKQVKFKTNPLNLPVLIFLTLTFISSIFSLDRFSSFFGYFGRFSDAWLGLFSLVIFYFLVINSGLADSREKIFGLLKLLFYSAAAVAALSLLAIAGVWRAVSGDQRSIFSSPSFNPAGGSLTALAIFLAFASVLAIAFLVYNLLKKNERYFFGAALALMLITLALVIFGPGLPREAVLNYGQSLASSRAALEANPALGSGPGTFAYDYSLYRPIQANLSSFWQIRFDKAGSQFLEMLATAGLFTALIYFLIISLMIYLSLKLLRKSGAAENLAVVLFTVFVLSFFSQIFFPASTVLNFIFWFFFSLLIAYWQIKEPAMFKEKIINLPEKFNRLSLSWPVLFLAGAGWAVLAAYEIKFFAADALAASGKNRGASLTLAVKLNPSRYNYGVSLAKFYLNRAKLEALKPASKQDNKFLNSNITLAIAAARQAADTAPDSVLVWETLGMIYRDLRPLVTGAEAWAVKSFNQALALEPANPVLAAELAKAYSASNDLAGAEKYFLKSLELKADYFDAKFGLAKVYLKEKKDGLGLKLLSELAGQASDPEVYYELGRYYYNHGEINKAIDRFNLVLSVLPKHSNSLFSLGIAYEAKGQIRQALNYYEKVLELNPGSEEVEKKIKELSK